MKIKVYSTPTCHFCIQLKDWLKASNIEFEDVDVASNQEAATYIVEKSGQMGVPVTEIVEEGNSGDILNNPQHAYTKGLLNCRTDLNFDKERLPVLSDFLVAKKEPSVKTYRRGLVKFDEEILKVSLLGKTFFSKRNFLGKYKQKKEAIKSLSFSVYKGETLGLVGESGCGKTTLGRSIARLVEITSGSIQYKGSPINTFSRKELKSFRKNVQIRHKNPKNNRI